MVIKGCLSNIICGNLNIFTLLLVQYSALEILKTPLNYAILTILKRNTKKCLKYTLKVLGINAIKGLKLQK